MKHLVKMQVVIETEETDTRKIAREGLQKIIKSISDDFVVVDVYKGCVGAEMICVNMNDVSKDKNGVVNKPLAEALSRILKNFFSVK